MSTLPDSSDRNFGEKEMKVFIADDSHRLRLQIIKLLSEMDGIKIIGQAESASEAFHGICELQPDVVTLDIQMVSGNGIDVLKKIKRADRSPVVIMLTNRTSLPYRKRCMEAGADFFLDKSTEFNNVIAIMQKLLERFDSPV
jgi:DNA-binding NarL/FixJ family response regulator